VWVAGVALLLLLLYIGSYLTMVRPDGGPHNHVAVATDDPYENMYHIVANYRFAEAWCEWFFWPLEKLDRMVRPAAWE
jgi:hypothetical protein